MRRVRSKGTSPERAVESSLKRLRFKPGRRKLVGSPDFVLPSVQAVLFVHGCFWHRHSCRRGQSHPTENHKFWAEKFERNIARDKRVARKLRRLGWRVLTVWECQIKTPESLDKLLKRKLGL